MGRSESFLRCCCLAIIFTAGLVGCNELDENFEQLDLVTDEPTVDPDDSKPTEQEQIPALSSDSEDSTVIDGAENSSQEPEDLNRVDSVENSAPEPEKIEAPLATEILSVNFEAPPVVENTLPEIGNSIPISLNTNLSINTLQGFNFQTTEPPFTFGTSSSHGSIRLASTDITLQDVSELIQINTEFEAQAVLIDDSIQIEYSLIYESPRHFDGSRVQDFFSSFITVDPIFVADDIVIDYSGGVNADDFGALNGSIISLAEKTYLNLLGNYTPDNFLISPTTVFTMAGFLDFSSAGESKKKIRDGLEWDVEAIWPLSTWFEQLGDPFGENISYLTNKTWLQPDYQVNDDYLVSLKNNFYVSLSYVDYIENDELVIPETSSNDSSHKTIQLIGTTTKLAFSSDLNIGTFWSKDKTKISEIVGIWKSGSENLKMPMLKWSGMFRHHETDSYQAVIIPLANESTSLTVIMVKNDENAEDDFNKVEADIFNVLEEIEQSYATVPMDFVLPHFSIQTDNYISNIIPDGSYTEASNVPSSPSSSGVSSRGYRPGSYTITYPQEQSTVNIITSDYSEISGSENLRRASLTVESYLNISTAGVKSESIGLSTIETFTPVSISPYVSGGQFNYADGFSQYTVISGNNGTFFNFLVSSEIIEGGSVRGNYLTECELIPESNPVDARPFLFVLKDLRTNSVLQIGRVKNLVETIAHREFCKDEKMAEEKNIWPKYPREVLVTQPHINTSRYQEKTSVIPDVINPVVTNMGVASVDTAENGTINTANFIKTVYNPLMIDNFHKGKPTSLPHSYLQALVQLGSTNKDALNFLDINDKDAAEELTLDSVSQISTLLDSKIWIEADYEIREDYLDILSVLNPDKEIRDLLNNPTVLISDVEGWADFNINRSVFRDFINNRTRLMFASSLAGVAILNGETKSGIFANDQEILTNIDVIQFEGEFKSLNTASYHAIEIPLSDENMDLLVVIPNRELFNRTTDNLSMAIEDFDGNAIFEQTTFSLPKTEEIRAQYDSSYQYVGNYRRVSERHSLIPRPQLTNNQFFVNALGINISAYSFTSFVAFKEGER